MSGYNLDESVEIGLAHFKSLNSLLSQRKISPIPIIHINNKPCTIRRVSQKKKKALIQLNSSNSNNVKSNLQRGQGIGLCLRYYILALLIYLIFNSFKSRHIIFWSDNFSVALLYSVPAFYKYNPITRMITNSLYDYI